jgi:hypothetical protein
MLFTTTLKDIPRVVFLRRKLLTKLGEWPLLKIWAHPTSRYNPSSTAIAEITGIIGRSN